MTDPRTLRIEPTAPTSGTEPVHAARHPATTSPSAREHTQEAEHEQAVATGGSLRAAYTEFVVNPDTDDVVVRIRDAATNQVLNEIPSREVQNIMRYLN